MLPPGVQTVVFVAQPAAPSGRGTSGTAVRLSPAVRGVNAGKLGGVAAVLVLLADALSPLLLPLPLPPLPALPPLLTRGVQV